jgi:hypothetical protein
MCLINLVGEHLYGMTPIEAWTRSSNNENKIEQEITTKMVIIVKQTMNDEMAI